MNIIGKAMSLAISLAVASAAFGAELSKSVPKGWDEDFEAGKATAEKSGKLILLAFSGSDWCGWCVKMEKEIYSDKNFIAAAKKKFVLLMIDNPQKGSHNGARMPMLELDDQKVTKFVLSSTYENADRRCWFDNRRQGQDRVARVQEAQGERPERL